MTDRTSPIPPLHVTMGHDEVFQWTDGIWITCFSPLQDVQGRLWSDIRIHKGEETFGRGQINLLDTRTRDALAASCAAVDGVVSWRPRLLCVADTLAEHLKLQRAAAGDIWGEGITAHDFCLQDDVEVPADVPDLVFPGAITIFAAPRASGKSIAALSMGIALATGGVFRGVRVPQRRVALIDRDNPPALMRRRLRLLGGRDVTGFRLWTREKAPPLTDPDAWAAFPVEQYDVVIIDSIGAATEGVSEREGKETQRYLATLKDLAHRGPAILALDNTNKAAVNYRGRGEKGDAVDILYECRNITGWTPTSDGDWWEDLPDFGEHTWQQRASRRKGQAVLHLACVPSKFRGGMDPAPFVLEIDMRQDPWTLTDITATIATAGAEAAQEQRRAQQQTLRHAIHMLVEALRQRHPAPILKTEAEALLQAQGLTRKVARTLLDCGSNHDAYPDGSWILRSILGERGNPMGVYLAGEGDHGENNSGGNNAR
jgi:AAA domain